MSAEQAHARSLPELARAWFVIGTQSVGGGTSALYLMRRELVERRRWLSQREYLEDWALSKLSLGINQIAQAGLLGMRVAGPRGVGVALAAYLIPSGLVTAVMTAGYEAIRGEPLVQAALAGAGPVAAGMAVGMAYVFATGALRRGWKGVADRAYWLLVVAGALTAGLSPIVLILSGIAVGLLFLRGEGARAGAGGGT